MEHVAIGKRHRPAIDRPAIDRERNFRIGITGITEMARADQEMKWPGTSADPGFDRPVIGSR